MSLAAMNTSALFRVDGMVAVVTGGGTGIGLMMAQALQSAGASKVYILGRRKETLEAAATEHPGCLIPIVCDVTSKASLQAAVDVITSEAGHVNLLIANSGCIGPTKQLNGNLPIRELRKSLFEDASMEDFTDTLHVNVTGAYFTMLAFLELLDAGNKKALAGGFGAPIQGASGDVPSIQSQVIFTSSVSAWSRDKNSALAYCASKAAISRLAKHASANLSRHEIRVNMLAPGLFPTALSTGHVAGRDPGKEEHSDWRYIPARRFGGSEEMAGSVLYLASRAGSFCNGLVLLADGGRSSVMLSDY